jgi:transketolase
MTTATATDQRALEELSINTIRTLSMDAVQKANSGHPGAPMALAPLAYVLYTRVMKHSPSNANWFDRDRFVLSAGHASMLLYSILHLTGYDISLDDLKHFRQLGSPTAGHPEYEYESHSGIEATTGPLGQGISMSVGMALAEAMLAERFNRSGHELIDHHTYVIASDGDIQEGVASEACSLAGHLGLGKLCVFYDNNHIQLAGETAMAFSENVGKRFDAYGWHVQDVGEDLSTDTLQKATEEANAVPDRPSLVIVRSHIGYGSPNAQDTHKAHGSPLGEEEVRLTKEAYGWDPDAKFLVPDEVRAHYGECVERGKELEAEWNERVESYRSEHSELWDELSLVIERRLPEGWDSDVPKFRPEDGMIATRKASGQVIQWAASKVPQLVSGSADLEPSTLTLIEDGGSVEKGGYAGRNVHYGVREHAMGAIVNGLNLHGLRAFGSTFFNFLDYMKPPVRLAALMHLPSIFVFTHDSIGLGEDGPTHQPIEQLAVLRAEPNTYAVRPAGANETALAWRFAIEQEDTPVALVFSRQGLPVWNPSGVPDDAIHRGAYVLRESYKEAEPDLILIGTGSEVHICTAAADQLEAEGIATRVVSMPCMDRFAEQDQDYRDSVLPEACRARVAVEAASIFGWREWVTEDGEVIGMTTFGASAPATDLYKHFGFTPEKVIERARMVVERLGARAG